MRRIIPAVLTTLSLAPALAAAHHSVAAWFNQSETQEIEGIVTEIKWENPHVRFFMRAPNAAGEEVVWEIETLSQSGISRWGVTSDLLAIGDRVRVAGHPSRRGLDNVFVRNVLLPSGQELVFGGEPRYSDDTLRGSELVDSSEGDGSRPDLGIFRVWSTGLGSQRVFPENFERNFDFSYYPLTESAKAAVAAFDYEREDPTNGCVPKGMPLIMEQPYPIEFIDGGDEIVLRIEEYDRVRTIHMDASRDGIGSEPRSEGSAPGSPLGYSSGRWDGDDLIVTTTRINAGVFDSVGVPLSEQTEVVERFAPSEDGARLDYTMTVTDPVNFTEPVETGKHWIWLPGATVEPFNCTE